VKERCVRRSAAAAAVRGEGEWLACLVLMWVLVNGIRAIAGSVQGVRRNGVTGSGALKKPSVQFARGQLQDRCKMPCRLPASHMICSRVLCRVRCFPSK
jgi:hypothetical protein